jgi:hypothetical protein
MSERDHLSRRSLQTIMGVPGDLAALTRHAARAGDQRLLAALQQRLRGTTTARPRAAAAYAELTVRLELAARAGRGAR